MYLNLLVFFLSSEKPECPEGSFRCNTGKCIDGFKQCDEMLDCPGGEDEKCSEGKLCS